MTIMTGRPQYRLRYWAAALPLLTLAFALAVPEIDTWAHTPDEFYSMHLAGWLVGGPYSPAEVLRDIRLYSPSEMPAYPLLLSAWGNLTAMDIAIGRVLSVYFGLLSLAMIFRLAQDFVSPKSGLPALVLAASTAFVNLYWLDLRTYSLLVFLSCVVLWKYLQIVHRRRMIIIRDYIFLGATVFLLIASHAFSLTLLLALGIYHILFIRKDRLWTWVSATVAAAVLALVPLLIEKAEVSGIISGALSYTSLGPAKAVEHWLIAFANGQPALLMLSIAGLFVGAWRRQIILKPWLLIGVLFLLVYALVAQFTDWIHIGSLRYHLVGWAPFVLVAVSGLFAWICIRGWLAGLILLWVAAGLSMQAGGLPQTYARFKALFHDLPPAHIVSRSAVQYDPKPVILAYAIADGYESWLHEKGKFFWTHFINYSPHDHYFQRQGISHFITDDTGDFGDRVRENAVASPYLIVYFQNSLIIQPQRRQIETILDDYHYAPCWSRQVGSDTAITHYSWQTLRCQPAHPLSEYSTEKVIFRFIGAYVDIDRRRLVVSYSWVASAAIEEEQYAVSLQLINGEWENVAQVDIPLVYPDSPQTYFIDTDMLSSGRHRLVAIIYDRFTGERLAWFDNQGFVAELQELSDVDIP